MTEPKPILPGVIGPIERDRDGAPWEVLPAGRLRCVAVTGDGSGPGETWQRHHVEHNFGPLVPEPRTWNLPPEPGPEVRAVRTDSGDLRVRDGDQWRDLDGCGVLWDTLVIGDSPLTDATAEIAAQDGASA